MAKNGFLVLAGFFFLIAALLQFVGRPISLGRIELYRNAPILEVAQVKALPAGRPFRVSAIVEATNTALYRDLVAFDIEDWTSGTGTSGGSWWTSSSETPPLLLRGRDGETMTLGGNYSLSLVSRVYELGAEKRYRGLVAGDSVGVYGEVAGSPAGPRILGETVMLGNAATLLSNEEAGVRIVSWLVGGALAVGFLCLAGHELRRRRLRR